jgi:hypothetical protein
MAALGFSQQTPTAANPRFPHLEKIVLGGYRVLNMNYKFANLPALQSITLGSNGLTTAANSSAIGMLANCTALKRVGIISLPTKNVSEFFSGCTSLTSIGNVIISYATNATGVFRNCTALTEVPYIGFGQFIDVTEMFAGCTSLTTFGDPMGGIDLGSVIVATDMFVGCVNLDWSYGVAYSCDISFANCNLSAEALDFIYGSVSFDVTGTITVTGNPGVGSDDPSIAEAWGWVVVGS